MISQRATFFLKKFSYFKYLTMKCETRLWEKSRETCSANRRLRIILAHFLSQGPCEQLELVTISMRPPVVYGIPPILTHSTRSKREVSGLRYASIIFVWSREIGRQSTSSTILKDFLARAIPITSPPVHNLYHSKTHKIRTFFLRFIRR